jgi:PEP-CTERM motif
MGAIGSTFHRIGLLPRYAAVAALCAGILLIAASEPAAAITITVTDPTPHPVRSIENCVGWNDAAYTDCESRGYVDTARAADASNPLFKDAFAAWNEGIDIGSKWTLVDGGILPDLQFDVTLFDAEASAYVGGFSNAYDEGFNVEWSYSGDRRATLFWSQAVSTNTLLTTGEIVPAFLIMDVAGSGCVVGSLYPCAPLYPYQYDDRSFYDAPASSWPNGRFNAVALLSMADYATRTLTVYDGVSWGFVLSAVPEPASWVMLLSGLGLALLVARRKGSGRSCRKPARNASDGSRMQGRAGLQREPLAA